MRSEKSKELFEQIAKGKEEWRAYLWRAFRAKFFKFLAQNNVHGTIGVKGDEIYNTDYFVKNHSSIDNSYFDIVSPIFDKHNDALSKFLITLSAQEIKSWATTY